MSTKRKNFLISYVVNGIVHNRITNNLKNSIETLCLDYDKVRQRLRSGHALILTEDKINLIKNTNGLPSHPPYEEFSCAELENLSFEVDVKLQFEAK